MEEKYHEDPKIDKKIRALFKWFSTEKNNFNLKYRLRLVNRWIEILVNEEEYEAADSFVRYKKAVIFKKMQILRRANRKNSQHLHILFRIYKRKLNSKIKIIFS